MRFAPLFATLCAFASIASAAPLVAPPAEEKRLLNLGGLLSNPKVTQLQTIVTGLDSQTAPVLTKIRASALPLLSDVRDPRRSLLTRLLARYQQRASSLLPPSPTNS